MDLLDPPTGTLSTDPKMWAWRVGTAIGVLLVIILQLWSSSTYLNKSEYERDKARVITEKEESNRTLLTINNTLIRMDEKMKGDDTRDSEIRDHEKRIRELERMSYGKAP